MKKLFICLGLLLSICAVGAIGAITKGDKTVRAPRKVQGIDYAQTIEKGKSGTMLYDDMPNPPDMAASSDFTMDMIKNWTGEGENEAALVIQWNDDGEEAALVFGYRWDGTATGADMMKAVVRNNPRLYALMQYTNVSSPTDPIGGYTLNGVGWDTDNDGDIKLIDTGHNNQSYESEDGFFEHPRGYVPGVNPNPDYDYDNWTASDQDDLWGAGWYLNYWSYWVKDSFNSPFSYSSWGISARVLKNGSWDAWNYSLDMVAQPWKNFMAAPVYVPAGVPSEFVVDGLRYTYTDYKKKTVALTTPAQGSSYTGEITVPATFAVDGTTYTVVAIDDEAFKSSTVTTVSLPATVTKIGKSAFASSTLATLNIPDVDQLKKIGAFAFDGCTSFSTLILPSSMKEIPEGMYKNTGVTSVTMGANIETIGKRAFENCQSLTEVNVPATVKSLGEAAFAGCAGITSVKCESPYPLEINDNTFNSTAYANATLYVPGGFSADYAAATGWKNFQTITEFSATVNVGDLFQADGVTYRVTSADAANPTVKVTYSKFDGAANLTSICNANKTGYTGDVVIPETVTYQERSFAVTELNDTVFAGASKMTSLDIQAKVDRISQFALYLCNGLTQVTLPSTVKTIEASAFQNCEKLTSLQLPEGLTTLDGNRQFYQCSALKSLTIPAGVTAIPNQCFANCKALTSVTLHDGITQFGNMVFQNCEALTSVNLPSGMTEIPRQTFQNCAALETLAIPATVTAIREAAFSGCTKLNISLSSTVTTLEGEAFSKCKALTEFTVPSEMAKIPSGLFNGCSNLTKVTMSDNVTEFGSSAFSYCSNLNTIVIADGQPAQNAAAREAATGISLPSKLQTIGVYAFNGCSSITAVEIPAGVKAISSNAFNDCTSLATIYLPETVTSIGTFAFGATALKQLVIPAATSGLNNLNLIYGCSGITVYVCAPTPTYILRDTFRTASGVYAPVVTPTGTAATYLNKNNWGNSEITSPALQSLNLSDAAIAKEGSNITLTGRVSGNYDLTDLPEQFLAANNKYLFAGKTIKVRYRTGSAAEYSEADATVADDGTFTATFTALSGSTYEVALAANIQEADYTSSAVSLTVASSAPFHFAQSEYDAHFDESFTPELVFDTDEYTLSDVEFTSSNTDVASVVKRTGKVTVKRVAGDAVITAQLKTDASVKAEITVHAALRNPVQQIILGDDTKTINLTYLDILALAPTVLPENADVPTYDITISNQDIATTHPVTSFNPTRKFHELVTHQVGECDVTFTAQDGSGVSSTYHVIVNGPDRAPLADNYQDGTFWLNEEWFTHTNGSINYITKDKDIKYRVYESQNPYQSFGATSQYGMIYAGKLIVMSKQNDDGGDPRKGGGRVVVADAKTLKKLAAFDYIGADIRPSSNPDGKGDGDGRACVGVNGNKVYLGTTAGVQVLDLNTLTLGGIVEGIPYGTSVNNQVGDMVAAGNYAFAVVEAMGVYVIDTATDAVVKIFPAKADDSGVTAIGNPQGITQSMDGNVWVAATNPTTGRGSFCCINPATLEVTQQVQLPSGISVTCGWGAWRSTNFQGAKKENALWFGAGTPATVTTGNSGYYKWVIGTDISAIQPVFVFPKNLAGVNDQTFQEPYATARYDDRSNELLIAATHGASANYRNNWLHFVNCETGEISKTIEMKKYYWFPSMPIFPDKYAPEFGDIEPVSITYTEGEAPESKTLDLTGLVTDRDNIDANIRLSIASEDSDLFDATLEGKVVTITAKPEAFGEGSITVTAESNGVVTTIDIPVDVRVITGVDGISSDKGIITVSGRTVRVLHMEGTDFVVYDMSGRAVSAFNANSNDARIRLTVPDGIYIICSADGKRKVKAAVY